MPKNSPMSIDPIDDAQRSRIPYEIAIANYLNNQEAITLTKTEIYTFHTNQIAEKRKGLREKHVVLNKELLKKEKLEGWLQTGKKVAAILGTSFSVGLGFSSLALATTPLGFVAASAVTVIGIQATVKHLLNYTGLQEKITNYLFGKEPAKKINSTIDIAVGVLTSATSFLSNFVEPMKSAPKAIGFVVKNAFNLIQSSTLGSSLIVKSDISKYEGKITIIKLDEKLLKQEREINQSTFKDSMQQKDCIVKIARIIILHFNINPKKRR